VICIRRCRGTVLDGCCDRTLSVLMDRGMLLSRSDALALSKSLLRELQSFKFLKTLSSAAVGSA